MNTKLFGFILLALVLIGGVFYFIKTKEDSRVINNPLTQKKTMTFGVVVSAGKVLSNGSVLSATEGDTVVINILSDVSDEVHLHGYDISINLEKNVSGTLTFVASKTGRFMFELENKGMELGVIEVFPK